MIFIKGISYAVKYFKPEDNEPDNLMVPAGIIDSLSATVFLRDDAAQQVQEETFIHEVVHGLTFNEEHVTEAMVARVGADLYDFLTRNGLLRKGWWDSIIDDRDDEKGRMLANDAINDNTTGHLDAAAKAPVPR